MVRTSQERIEHKIGANGRLTVRGVSGDVSVRGIDGDAAVVVATVYGTAKLNVSKTDGALLVEQIQRGMLGGIFDRESVDFEVTLPKGAYLDVRTVSGDIAARDLTGEQNINAVSGDVSLHAVTGRLTAMSVSGDLQLNTDGSLEVSATTTSGDLQLTADRLSRLSARSVSGDVVIHGLLEPGPRHSVETVSGDLSLESTGGVTVELARAVELGRGSQPIVVGDGAARLVFRTLSGDHEIRGGRRQSEAAPARPPAAPAPRPAASQAFDRLEILRALERGEIDIDEATRRLEGVTNG